MLFKTFAFAAFMVAASPSHASFELMLVANSANGTIQRYDAETGTYLGAFGFGTGLSKITAHRDTNTVYAKYGIYTRRFNFNTGAYLGESIITNNTDLQISADGTKILTADGTKNVNAYDSKSGANLGTFYTSPFSNIGSVSLLGPGGSLPNGYIFGGVSGAAGRTTEYTTSGGSFSTSLGSSESAIAVSRMGGQNDGVAFATPTYLYAGGYQSGASGNFYNSTFSSIKGAAPAHFGAYFAGLNTAGTAGIIAQYSTFASQLRTFSPISGTVISDIDTILAPEPGAVLALGIGLGLIVRRRKSR